MTGIDYFNNNRGSGAGSSQQVRKVDPVKFSDAVAAFIREEGGSEGSVLIRVFGAKARGNAKGSRKARTYEQNPHIIFGTLEWSPQLPTVLPMAQYGDERPTGHAYYINKFLLDPNTQEFLPDWDGDVPVYVEAVCPSTTTVIAKTVVIPDGEDDEPAMTPSNVPANYGMAPGAGPSTPMDAAWQRLQASLADQMVQQVEKQLLPSLTGQGQPGTTGGANPNNLIQLENGTFAPLDWVVRAAFTQDSANKEVVEKLAELERKLADDNKDAEPTFLEKMLEQASPHLIQAAVNKFLGGGAPAGMPPGMPGGMPGMGMPGMGMPGAVGGPPAGGGGGMGPLDGIAQMFGIDPAMMKTVFGQVMGGAGFADDDDDDYDDYDDDEEDDYIPPTRRPRTTGRAASRAGDANGIGSFLHGSIRQPTTTGRTAAGRTPDNSDYHSGLAALDPTQLQIPRPAPEPPPAPAHSATLPRRTPAPAPVTEFTARDETAIQKITPLAIALFEHLYPSDPNNIDIEALGNEGVRQAPSFARRAGLSTFWLKASAQDPQRMARWMAEAISREFPGVTDGWHDTLEMMLSTMVTMVDWTA